MWCWGIARYIFGSVLVLLFCLPNQVICDEYLITPEEITDDCRECITLSQLAVTSSFLESNTTLIFLPGSHVLTAILNITDINHVFMAASRSIAQITCELSIGFSIINVHYTTIHNLEFIGCGSNYIKNVIELVLQNVTFEGHEESGTALVLIETTAILSGNTFKSNIQGTLRSKHSNDFWVGGAIVVTHSHMNIKNCMFERNRAEVGGAIYTEQDSTISIRDTTFVENQALVHLSTVEPSLAMGGVLYQETGSVRITNCLFTNNSAPNFNGGVLYSYATDVFIKDSQFVGNTANNGTVLFSYNSSVSVDTSQCDRNTATWGGVVHSFNSDVLIDQSQFSDNRASMGGGIVHSTGGTVTLNDSHFYRNRATWGGILHVIERTMVTVTGSRFNSSTATTHGGVFYCSAGDITIQSSQFYNNSANSPDEEYTQGGVLHSLNGNVHINDCQFYKSAGTYFGGALNSITSSISISNSQFHGHKAISGGVLSLFSSSIIIEADSQFDENSADFGGAIYAYISDVIIRDGIEFSKNTAADQGGAIWLFEAKISVNISYFYWNSAATDGGALYSADSRVEIEGSKFKYNRALNGGAVIVYRSKVTLNKNVLNNNIATSTAGVLHCTSNSDVIVQDCTLNNNTATVRAGSLFCSNSNVVIQASILNNNTANRAGVLESFNSDITVYDCQMSGNNVSTRGGVFYSSNSNIVVHNSEMNHSRASGNGRGGVLYSFNSRVRIYESLFHNNTETGEGGVLYSNRSDIEIYGSHFNKNIAIFFGGVLSSTNDNVTIHESIFSNSFAVVGGASYCTNSSILMIGSQFNGNSAMSGGVVDSFINSNVTLERSQFYDNRAVSLGATLLIRRGYVTISHSKFRNNTCDRLGGVLLFFQSQVAIRESQFNESRASQGSALYAIESDIKAHSLFIHNNTGNGTFHLSESTITVSNTSFTSNVGSLLAIDTIVNFTSFNSFKNSMALQISRINFEEGGALTAFQSTIYFEGITIFQNNQADNGGAIHSTESVLNITGTTVVSHNTATRNGGGVYLSQSEVFCQPSSLLRLEKNTASRQGGGLHAIGSSVKVSVITNETLVNVEGNMAGRGGGLSFDSSAKLYVLKRVEFKHPVYAVQIVDNSADYGGALYVNDDNSAAACESPSTECFLQVLAIHRIRDTNTNTVNLYVSSNSVRRSVSSATLFGGLLDRCIVSPLAEVHNRVPHLDIVNYVYNQSGLDYFLDSTEITPDTISSDPVKVCFCFSGYTDCGQLEPESRNVKKGESFVVSLIAVDQIGQPVTATIRSSLMFTQSGLAEGQLFQEVTDNCTDLTFNVFSSERYEVLTLYADGPCKDADISRRSILIEFLPCTCPIGFQPRDIDDTTCNCHCHKYIIQYVETCDDQSRSFVRRMSSSSVWITYSNNSGYLIYPNCPYDYCKHPSLGTLINLNLLNGSDAQCTFNRVSILCGSCEPGLSLSLGSSLCLPCPHYWPALLVVIILAAALAGVALVAMLLFLNLTVAVGSLNGIIFYANIVAANKSIFFPYQAEPSFASICISFLNLDIGINTCFFEGMTTYTKTWLQLVFPLYVILLVVLLIVISSYSNKFSNLIGKKDPVATLATLILLSYARLLGISFIALSPGTLMYEDGSHQMVWLPDATIAYFSGVYIPLFIAAILIVILGLLYTTVVFFWQWLVRLPKKRVFAWTRNQKLQIFIETYNIPYTPHHRYWTGILLLVRVILYLIAAVNVSNDPYTALTSITFIIVCILCLKGLTRGRVFKNWPVDLLESFFYFNILFLAIFTWYSLSTSNNIVNQIAVINVSVIITFIVLFLIILYHVYSYTPIFLKFRETKIGKRLDEKFKSFSSPKTKQRNLEANEDNLVLEMVHRPTNIDGYKGIRKECRSAEPTQSVLEVPVPILKPDSAREVSKNEKNTLSSQKCKESGHYNVSSDMEKYIADKTQALPHHEQI